MADFAVSALSQVFIQGRSDPEHGESLRRITRSHELALMLNQFMCVSEKLGRNGDYLLSYRDPSGAPLEPRLLVDCKDKAAVCETDIKKLIRDAKERRITVGVIVTKDESQLRQVDREWVTGRRCLDTPYEPWLVSA
jgi:hypothetical protein